MFCDNKSKCINFTIFLLRLYKRLCSILVRLNSLVFCIYVFCQISRKRWKARIPKQSCTKEFKRYVFCIHPLNLTFVNFVIYQEFRVPGPSLYHLIGSGSYRSRQEAGGPGPSLHSIMCLGSYRSRQEAGALDLPFILLSVQVPIDLARRLGAPHPLLRLRI